MGWRGLGGFELLVNDSWMLEVNYDSEKENGFVGHIMVCDNVNRADWGLGDRIRDCNHLVRDISEKIFLRLETSRILVGDYSLDSYFTYVPKNFDEALSLYRDIEGRKKQGEKMFAENLDGMSPG